MKAGDAESNTVKWTTKDVEVDIYSNGPMQQGRCSVSLL